MNLFSVGLVFFFLSSSEANQDYFIRGNFYSNTTYNLICRDKLDSAIITLTYLGKCIENRVDNKYLPLLKKCWNETGVEYPTSNNEWTSFYCNNKSPWIIKNMAEHCFIARFKGKR